MPKSTKKSSQTSSTSVVAIIGAVLLVVAAIGAEVFLGIDITGFFDSSDSETIEGEWYTLSFTRPINTNNRSEMQNSSAENALIEAIDSAQESIDGALFELNLEEVTEAFLRAHDRGVEIRLVVDDEHAFEDKDSTVERLMDVGIEIKSDERGALMHHKFLIIDGKKVWTGSMNFQYNDVYNNNNNAILIESVDLAANYQDEFEEMFTNREFTRRDNSYEPVEVKLDTDDGTVLIETYFSPENGVQIEERLVELIGEARNSVRFMAFSFTLDDLGGAMISAFDDGVTVEGVFETTGSKTDDSEMTKMLCAGMSVKQDGNPDVLHHKVIIIDSEIVAFGSFNFSNSARDNNSENILIVHSPELAEQYETEFERIYNDPRAEMLPDDEYSCR